MVGVQWCKACEGPRFKWHVRNVEDIPEHCLDCGGDEVEVRLVGDTLTNLRRALGQWALGDDRTSGHASWLNKRRARVQERFDQVIGWWAKQPSQPPEFKKLLREYRNRGRPRVDPEAEPGAAHREPGAAHRERGPVRKRLDADRLHELTEKLRAEAEEERKTRETPKEPVRSTGPWRIMQRSAQQQAAGAAADLHPEDSMVKCALSGGEKDPREITIPLIYCRDTIRVEHDVWFARQQNGDVAIMKGGNRIAANWMTFFTDVYHKVDKVKDNRVTYKFEKTVEVNRCEATTKKGQRCRHQALEGSKFCDTHVLRTS